MRLLIDGFHSAVAQGTGIATYARHVSLIAKELGYSVDVLHDAPVTTKTPAALAEVMVFDAHRERPPQTFEGLRDLIAILPSIVGRAIRAHEVLRTGFVVDNGLTSRLPVQDRMLAVASLRARAAALFTLTGRFLEIETPGKVDIAHWSYPMPLRIREAKNVYTIHDLAPLKLPYASADDKLAYYRLIEAVTKSADRIIVVSETTARDLLELFPDCQNKIANTSQSVLPPQPLLDVSQAELDAELEKLLGLRAGGYFLFYSTFEARKNVGRLVEAYLAAETDCPLIMVGAKGAKLEDEFNVLQYSRAREARGGAPAKVVQMDYVSLPKLITLIRGARAVLFPSIYEGFGLPILEAMICGTPVLTSNIGAMAEIATPDSAVLVDPYDIRDIRRGIERLSSNEKLRLRLAKAGAIRATAFSWDRYRDAIAEIYRQLAAP